MRKFWYFTAFCLVIIGVAGALTYDWKSKENLPEFEKQWSFSASELRNLEIVSDYNVAVTFTKSEDGRNSIRLNGQGTEKMIENTKATEIADGKLKLDLTRMPKKYINFFDFDFGSAKEQLVISVTDASLLDSLRIKLDSGNITVTDAALETISEAKLTTDSGNITLTRFKSEKLIVGVDSGNITGNEVAADIKASTDSGNIKLDKVTGPTRLSVDSGNIRLTKQDNASSDLSTDSGNVYVQVPASFAGSYDLRTDSGSVHAPESKRTTMDYIKIRTDSGNIRVEEGPQ
ncbi:DUF4097 family beta strand repeat-containing protein [Cohnella endophytica]|nr:DUF4097 family beta strand repeat-containing protein [Cohnella endophytica]